MADTVIKCSVCHGLLDEEDLFCSNCGTEAPLRTGVKPPPTATSTCNFQCSACGASMSYDASAQALRCPFCGSTELKSTPDARTIAPTGVVPFIITRESAVAAMRTWLGQGYWRPGDLSEQALVVKMTPIYVPYWVFEAQTHTFWTADTGNTPAGARSQWYPLGGQREGHHGGVLIGASGALTPSETSAICPFDLSAAVSPDEVDLNNAIYEQFSLARKYARPQARAALESLELREALPDVPGSSRNLKVNTRFTDLMSEPVLLPVWIMAYRYQDHVFRFLVNGQTGRSTGQAPVSWRKIGAAVVIGVLAILLFLFFAGISHGSDAQSGASPWVQPPATLSDFIPDRAICYIDPVTEQPFQSGSDTCVNRCCKTSRPRRKKIATSDRSACATWSGSARCMPG